MRHAVKGRKLGRTASHRKSTLNSLATALFRHKKIKTTLAKAKETRVFAEKLITKARKNDLSARRHISRFVKDRDVLKELFGDIILKVGERPGGYTRVIKLGSRKGDGADLAVLELVDYNEGTIQAAKERADAKAARKAERKAAEGSPVEESKVVEEAKVIEEVKESEVTSTKEEKSDEGEASSEEKK
ncbi:MAG: 50S ribosomal protein L17 [Ignavibacteria bacterium]|nr:50S ribosomal protein L17 [Ignavibacteria bacterium]